MGSAEAGKERTRERGTRELRDYGTEGLRERGSEGVGERSPLSGHVAGEPIDGAPQHVAAVGGIGEAVAFVGVDD